MKRNFLTAGAALLLLLCSCQNQPDGNASAGAGAPAREADEAAGHEGEIVLDSAHARTAGIRTATVQPGPFHNVIATSGQILTATGDEATLVANVAGIVSFAGRFTEGSAVRQGSTVFTIATDRMQDGDPVEKARVAYAAAQAEYERGKGLVKEQIISQKDFTTLQANYETARIAYEALAADRGRGGIAVRASMSGYVKACLVKEGDYVTAGQPLMTLTQQRRLYLRADVPERYYASLGRIGSARFTTSYDDRTYDMQELHGRLMAYGRTASDTAPYVPVTFEFDNRGDLVPGAYVEVYLLTDERQGVLSVPRTALTEDQGVYFVYVQHEPNIYQKREVTLGDTDGQRVEIRRGLKAGETVAVENVMHIKLAAARSIIPAHDHQH